MNRIKKLPFMLFFKNPKIILSLIGFIFSEVFGQAPIADFSFEDNACLGSPVEFNNLSTNSDSYFWDFCTGDLDSTPSIESYLSMATLSSVENVTVYRDNIFDSTIYVFIASGIKEVYKSKLTNNFSPNPTFTPLPKGTFTFSRPIDFEIVKFNGRYIGFMADFTSSRIYEYDFGTSLDSVPVITDLGLLSINRPYGLKPVVDEGKIKILVSNYGSSYLTLISRNEVGEYSSIIIPTGTNQGWGIDLMRVNGNWIASIAYRGANLTKFINFGSAITGSFLTSLYLTDAELINPSGVQLLMESGELNCLAKSSANGMFRIKFGSTYNDSPNIERYGNLDMLDINTRGFQVIQKANSDWEGLIVQSSNIVNKIRFEGNCDLDTAISMERNPTITFNMSGKHKINLTSYNSGGFHSSISKEITISENQAPRVNISIDNAYCITTQIRFNIDTRDEIVDYLWDFGDGNISNEPTPSHTYLSSGNYLISLTVNGPEGCSAIYTKVLTIYDPVIPDFKTEKSSYCSFEPVVFENLTINEYGADLVWHWDFNGEGTSAEMSPQFSFVSSGEKTISLVANVLGCEISVQKTISVIDGPQVSFDYSPVCLAQSVHFMNHSIGENISSYEWDFGNGHISIEYNPSTSFDTAGAYPVILTVTNGSGCKNSAEQTIKVYDQIIDSIEISQAIENIPFSASIELVSDINFEIGSHIWTLDDFVSNDPMPSFTIAPEGNYNLSVMIETTDGCRFTDTIVFNVGPSLTATVDFNFKDNLCLNELTQMLNHSINAEKYEWDFCPGNFENPPIIKDLINNSSLTQLENSTIYKENVLSSESFLFFASGNGQIYRAIANSDMAIQKPLTALPTNEFTFTRPTDFSVVKFKDMFYGFMVDFTSNKLYEYNFGPSLKNEPTVKEIGPLGSLNKPYSLRAVIDEGKIKMIISNYGANYLTLVTRNEDLNYVSSNIPTGTNQGWDIDLLKHQGVWMAAVAYSSPNFIRLLNLGDTLSTNIVNNTSISNLGNPTSLQFIREGININLIVRSVNNGLIKLNFGNDLYSSPTIEPYGNLGVLNTNTRGFSIVQNYASQWVGTIVQNESIVWMIKFEKSCPMDTAISLMKSPIVSFSSPGLYPIMLTAKHDNGSLTSLTKQITIEDTPAPLIDFNFSPNRCINSEINIALSSDQTLTDNSWSFGDGNSSVESNPSHIFLDSGLFNVRLDVQSENGCRNFKEKQIPIYSEPVPDFAMAEDILCSHSDIPFTNTSQTFGADSVIQWSWNFNDEASLEEKSPSYNFPEGGVKTVSLTASIPGCAPTAVRSFNLAAGPDVDFTAENLCFGQELAYTNLSSGEGITGYQWDLGNTTASTDKDPALVYDTAGDYRVRLETTNDLGCVNFREKTVTVHYNPVAAFDYGLACSSGTQFMDRSAVERANLTYWQWSLMKNGKFTPVSTEKNPLIATETAGAHRVKLVTGSNYGCLDSMETEFTTLPGPSAALSHKPICLGDSTQFLDLSTSLPENPIEKWYWTINGKGVAAQEPKYLFPVAGSYDVSLKVDAQNLCSDMAYSTVLVPRLPKPAFTTSRLCLNENIRFTNNTISPDDAVHYSRWDFAGLATRTGQVVYYQFPEAKEYPVKLSVETENGCKQSITKSIAINKPPQAKFTLSPLVGVPPQPVTLTNASTGASAYRWDFREHVDSVLLVFEPEYTFTSLGDYDVNLIAINDKGCMDSASNRISIRVPALDAQLDRILKVVNNGDLQLVAHINNTGSLNIDNMDVVIDMGKVTVKEKYPGSIEAGEDKNYPVNFRISDFLEQGLEYACITLEPSYAGYSDLNPDNNRICISLNDLFTLLEPYPNPASDILMVSYIASSTDKNIPIALCDLSGRCLIEENTTPAASGLNFINLDVSSLAQGVYILKAIINDQPVAKRIVISDL